MFMFADGNGFDRMYGGSGWTDTVKLDGYTKAEVQGGWTMTQGSVLETGDDYMILSLDSAGVIDLGDGDLVSFNGMERIEW